MSKMQSCRTMFMLTNATLAMVLTLAQACTPATTEDPSAIDITKLTVMDLRQRLASGELSARRTRTWNESAALIKPDRSSMPS